jgi:hypothetical protein
MRSEGIHEVNERRSGSEQRVPHAGDGSAGGLPARRGLVAADSSPLGQRPVTCSTPSPGSLTNMSNSTHSLSRVHDAGDLWGWWHTLTEDQQDLLRITASSLPLSPPVVDFLVWTECPAVDVTDESRGPVLGDPGRLIGFVAHA